MLVSCVLVEYFQKILLFLFIFHKFESRSKARPTDAPPTGAMPTDAPPTEHLIYSVYLSE